MKVPRGRKVLPILTYLTASKSNLPVLHTVLKWSSEHWNCGCYFSFLVIRVRLQLCIETTPLQRAMGPKACYMSRVWFPKYLWWTELNQPIICTSFRSYPIVYDIATSKNMWSNISTPPIRLHGLLLS